MNKANANISSKYEQLDPESKQQVIDLVDNLLNKQFKEEGEKRESYLKKLASVSVWPEEEVQIFEENKKRLAKWEIPNW